MINKSCVNMIGNGVSSSFKCYWTGYRSARFSLMSEAIYPMKTALFKIPEKLLR